MLLGKRPRGSMNRTTSMSRIDVDVADVKGAEPSNHSLINGQNSPRINRKSLASNDCAVEGVSEFLKTCWMCKRRLVPGRDIYMYRGDTAFCSQECRDLQMKHDEKTLCSTIGSKKNENHQHHHHHPSTMIAATTSSEPCN